MTDNIKRIDSDFVEIRSTMQDVLIAGQQFRGLLDQHALKIEAASKAADGVCKLAADAERRAGTALVMCQADEGKRIKSMIFESLPEIKKAVVPAPEKKKKTWVDISKDILQTLAVLLILFLGLQQFLTSQKDIERLEKQISELRGGPKP